MQFVGGVLVTLAVVALIGYLLFSKALNKAVHGLFRHK